MIWEEKVVDVGCKCGQTGCPDACDSRKRIDKIMSAGLVASLGIAAMGLNLPRPAYQEPKETKAHKKLREDRAKKRRQKRKGKRK